MRNTMYLVLPAVLVLSGCHVKVENPPGTENTTIVNPPTVEKKVENTTVVNPPSTEKTTTTTTTK